MRDQLTYEESQQLLEMLSTDDTFRATFTTNPAEALRIIGITEFERVNCLRVQQLADKATIAAARLALTAVLTQKLALTVHSLDQGDGKGVQAA